MIKGNIRNMDRSKLILNSIGWFLSLFLMVSCFPSGYPLPDSHVEKLPTLTSTESSSVENFPEHLSRNQIATLSSLILVDKYPLYIMHFTGDYNEQVESGYRSNLEGIRNPATSTIDNWGCSLFATFDIAGRGVFGRNFDWQYSPSLLLFTYPSDGYASVSMVNLAFLHNWGDDVVALTDLPLDVREPLLRAPWLPIDGMNEHGLVVGMAAVPHRAALLDPNKETVGSLAIIRELLDHAKNVNEAIELLERFNIDWGGGPPIHYLVSDRNGESALIEFLEDKMTIIKNDQPWHLATNFLVASAGDPAEGNCWRYDLISQSLNEVRGILNMDESMDLLEMVSQPGTQWSIVYGINDGDIHLSLGRDYDRVYNFKLTRRIE